MTENNIFHITDNENGSVPLKGMYQNWFLDYASYVILERAIPAIEDGFKPVQRRIMHAFKELDDGRYNKIANIIGHTMSYHPHGDASIGAAIVNLGQKDLLIDTQGNWGDSRTGDPAAAARYIEGRLSKLALEIVFNPQTTQWQKSYDGRKKEPVTLPVKFPLLLMQGVEGIAVGLSTKILPHNFHELIDASIKALKNRKFEIYPDFHTVGIADFSEYKEGLRGGKVKVRAEIEAKDKKTLIIKSVPFGITTNDLIESIIKANEKGKIKIKNVVDSTAKNVEIIVTLAAGQSSNMTMNALYAFTDCEISISPNACVIIEEKPVFLTVSEILKLSTFQTKDLLNQELEIRRNELMEKIFFSSLEKIFIEKRIYRDIEECDTWEAVIQTIDKGLKPYKKQFYREITQEDIVKLTEIKIKRISKYDAFKANELLKKLNDELKEVEYNLENLTDYTIDYFKNIKKKYGEGRERKTVISQFENVNRTVVAANNQKLYVNRKDGFAGYGLKKEELIGDCSDIDDIIAFSSDGKCVIKRIQDKAFFLKDLIYVNVWKKGDTRMTYNMVYMDGHSGRYMVKRFNVSAITRDKVYSLTKSEKGSKVLYFTANPNGESEVITIKLTSRTSARKKIFDFDMASIDVKGRGANGNVLTRYPIRRIEQKTKGKSTLDGLELWFDYGVGKLNKNKNGDFLGKFHSDDMVLVVYKSGEYEITNFDITNIYSPLLVSKVYKYDEQSELQVIYYDGESKSYFAKAFTIETLSKGKKFNFISEHKMSKLVFAAYNDVQSFAIKGIKFNQRTMTETQLNVKDVIPKQGWKTIGQKLTYSRISNIVVNDKLGKKNLLENRVKNLPKEPDLFSHLEEKKTNNSAENKSFKPGDKINL